MRVAFHTLGCKLNFSETSSIRRQFVERGFTRVEFTEAADVYVINTCSVTDNADRKCRKIVKQALKGNSEALVLVTGCYAQLKPTEISEIPGVDYVLGANEKFRLFDIIESFVKPVSCTIAAGEIADVNDFHDAFSIGDRTRSFLKIQDGCDYKCTFCTIPLARGKSRSDQLANIVANAETIAKSGVKEVVLTGVNIGDFRGENGERFIDVVKALDEVEGIERFRISSIEPNLLSNEIIEFVAQSKRFMPHFHIPLQSGSNEILGLMKRRYKKELYTDHVKYIHELMPDACIGVDVIVGFPGETKTHFEETYQFLNELGVSYLHVFTYSERNNTPAREMAGVVKMEERVERSKMLRTLSEKLKGHFYQKFEGKSRFVLFESEENDAYMNGFSDNYIKVIAPYNPQLVNRIVECTFDQQDQTSMMLLKENLIPVKI